MLGIEDMKDALPIGLALIAQATALAAWLRKPGEDARNDVSGLNGRLIALEERTKHMPDSEELAKLEGMVKQVDERTAGLAEAITSIRQSQARVEQYLLTARG